MTKALPHNAGGWEEIQRLEGAAWVKGAAVSKPLLLLA